MIIMAVLAFLYTTIPLQTASLQSVLVHSSSLCSTSTFTIAAGTMTGGRLISVLYAAVAVFTFAVGGAARRLPTTAQVTRAASFVELQDPGNGAHAGGALWILPGGNAGARLRALLQNGAAPRRMHVLPEVVHVCSGLALKIQ